MRRTNLTLVVGIGVLLLALSANAGVVTTDLVSWWKFDDGSGTAAADSHGTNDGTVHGASWTTDTPGAASTGALDFDGTDDYVLVPDSDSLDITGGLTIDFWMKHESGDYGVPIAKHRYEFSPYEIHWHHENKHFEFLLDTYTHTYTSDTLTISGDTWYHYAFVFDPDNDQVRFYLDGEAAGVSATTLDALNVNDYDLNIGRDDLGSAMRHIDGIIDEVRIYDRALSQSEVQDNYNAIPEPATMALLLVGLPLALRRRFGRKIVN